MKLLSRYLRREVLLHAGLGLLLFTFVLFLQDLSRALEAVVGAGSGQLLRLLTDVVPAALVFTLPMALLVGLLIGLGRLGVDNETLALRAAGVSSRQMLTPLLQVTLATLALALVMNLWLAPAALRQLNELTASEVSAEAAAAIQPHVFFEPTNDPNLVVYAGAAGESSNLWRQVLVANMKDPEAPELIMAAEGELVRRGSDEIQFHLVRGAQYRITSAHPETSLVSSFDSIDLPFTIPHANRSAISLAALPPGALWQRARWGADWRAARVQYYRRWALAFSCLALALLGIPLGLRSGRGGKSGGFVLTLILVFTYYLLFIIGSGLASQGRLEPFWGTWAANLIFFAGGVAAMLRLDRVPRRPPEGLDPVARVRAALVRRLETPMAGRTGARRTWLPQLLETYVLREFLGYAGLLLAAFLLLTLVFTFFELTGSIVQHHIPLAVVLQYLAYFSPQMLYMTIPVAVLVGVLITFGLLSKTNEITAFKAGGISVHRLLGPVLLASLALAGLQFGLDATWLPSWNQKQAALHAQIKGQPPQTYRNPEQKWVFGRDNDIFYFRFFNPQQDEFADLSVFQYDPVSFRLTRRIFAPDVRWDSSIHGWVFTNGWTWRFPAAGRDPASFERFQIASFHRISEPPSYFATGSRQGSQMSFGELWTYIRTLRASGYQVAQLSIALWKKLSYPLITVIMALLAFPFALSVGRRGTVAGITVGVVVAIAYWSSASLLEALGNLNQLPAAMAAWTPDVVFLGLGLYLLLRVPT